MDEYNNQRPAPGSGKLNPGGKLGMPLGNVPIPKGKPPGGPLSWPPPLRRLLYPSSRSRCQPPSSCSSLRSRVDLGPWLPPLSVCMRRLIALEETPAPISISGSSTHKPGSIGRPPLPPYGAVSIHLRSASVSLVMGITLTPVA